VGVLSCVDIATAIALPTDTLSGCAPAAAVSRLRSMTNASRTLTWIPVRRWYSLANSCARPSDTTASCGRAPGDTCATQSWSVSVKRSTRSTSTARISRTACRMG
jgi:hypothetical protein